MTKKSNPCWHFMDIPAAKVADLCGVTLRTVENWKTGRTRPPEPALTLLALYRAGRIMPKSWSGARFTHAGDLCTSAGHRLTLSELDHYRTIVASQRSLAAVAMAEADKARKYRAELERLRKLLPLAAVVPFPGPRYDSAD